MQAELFKVQGERTGPAQFGGVNLKNGYTVRHEGLTHGTAFIDNGELRQLINNKDFMRNSLKLASRC